jgi:hypothetical protein
MIQSVFDFASRHRLMFAGIAAHVCPSSMTTPNSPVTITCAHQPVSRHPLRRAGSRRGRHRQSGHPAGDYAVGHFDLRRDEFNAAWDFMYAHWLTNSRFQPGDSYPYELYRSEPPAGPDGRQKVDICLPVEPLTLI